MSREIRRVPPNWEHPKFEEGERWEGEYKPMCNHSAQEAWEEWFKGFQDFVANKLEQASKEKPDWYPADQPYLAWCNYEGTPPDPEVCRPHWKEGEATWWQVYATVSEGTPVSPPFATQAELVDYLVANGDFWDQDRRKRGCGGPCQPWPREFAERFVYGSGWAPSLVATNGQVMSGVEALAQAQEGGKQ